MHCKKVSIITGLCAGIFCFQVAIAQENSPYSRFGLGDLTNTQNVINRALGGVSQAYADPASVNFVNPASYSNLLLTTFDFGLEGTIRRMADNSSSFRSGNGTISYLQLGLPLRKKWGMNIGLRPVSRVSYDIQRSDSLNGISKVGYLFQGNGGLYQVYTGTGIAMGNFSVGVNLGYLFGSIENSTKAIYPSGSYINNSNYSQRTAFRGFFWGAGMQYNAKLNKQLFLQLGATATASQNLKASQDKLREIVVRNLNGDYDNQDTVQYQTGVRGKITYPLQYGFGFVLHDEEQWLLGVDYTVGQWSKYRYYEQVDSLQDSWKLSVGGQFIPNAQSPNNYWERVAYRLGFYFGKDYVHYKTDLPMYAFTAGAGLPVRRNPYSNQFTIINLALEIGKRGNASNALRENFYRISVGLMLSDRWFIKRKYQ